MREFLLYLEGLVERRRAEPGDPEVDVLTRLIAGEGGEALSAPELLHNCIFLLNAGHETTTNLIGNGLACLLDWPDQKARLLAEPELVRTAVEEFLRFESSNQLGNRITTCATEIDGVALAPRTSVTIGIGAANRDPDAVRRPRSARHRAHAEPPRRVRLGHPPMRRHGPGAPRRPGRDRPLPGALSELPPRRAGAAAAARALSRPRAIAGDRRPVAGYLDRVPFCPTPSAVASFALTARPIPRARLFTVRTLV